MNTLEFKRLLNAENEKKRRCKCGNVVKITNQYGKRICVNCGRYVFLDKKEEFEYRLRERLCR